MLNQADESVLRELLEPLSKSARVAVWSKIGELEKLVEYRDAELAKVRADLRYLGGLVERQHKQLIEKDEQIARLITRN